jgi:hypothetical protein
MAREAMATLVLDRAEGRICPDDVRVGWLAGEHVLWWGRCTPAALTSLLADVRRKHGEVAIQDRRADDPTPREEPTP